MRKDEEILNRTRHLRKCEEISGKVMICSVAAYAFSSTIHCTFYQSLALGGLHVYILNTWQLFWFFVSKFCAWFIQECIQQTNAVLLLDILCLFQSPMLNDAGQSQKIEIVVQQQFRHEVSLALAAAMKRQGEQMEDAVLLEPFSLAVPVLSGPRLTKMTISIEAAFPAKEVGVKETLRGERPAQGYGDRYRSQVNCFLNR